MNHMKLLTAGFFALGAFLLLVSCGKPKLVGTSWKMYQEILAMDDGHSFYITKILKFTDETTVELFDETRRSGYSASYMNEDGTVDYTPGSTEQTTKSGTYEVKGDVVEVTIDNETTKYYIRGKKLIQEVDDDEYAKLSDFEKDYCTFKLMDESSEEKDK